MPSADRVRQCTGCQRVCDVMDTICPRCRRPGTLRNCFQCSSCDRLLDDEFCPECAAAMGIRAGKPTWSAQPEGTDAPPGLAAPDIADPYAAPPWIAGGIGGAVVGAIAGVVASTFQAIDPWIAGAIGVFLGAALGAILTKGNPANRGKGRL